jgi:hypothetical protein
MISSWQATIKAISLNDKIPESRVKENLLRCCKEQAATDPLINTKMSPSSHRAANRRVLRTAQAHGFHVHFEHEELYSDSESEWTFPYMGSFTVNALAWIKQLSPHYYKQHVVFLMKHLPIWNSIWKLTTHQIASE